MISYQPSITIKTHALNEFTYTGRCVVITESNIPSVYIDTLKQRVNVIDTITLPTGETAKNVENYVKVLERLETLGVDKSVTIIAIGGGVITDLGAFVAATYKRGLPLVLIPTTLLAMVDAAIGGKCGINMRKAKNNVGTFYEPNHIIIDPKTLITLPARQINSGMAEIIKIALMRDAEFFYSLNQPFSIEDLENVIKKAVQLKMAIVEADYKEFHTRKLLNYGHTIGHAIEQASNYALTHGECIAIGMKWMARDKPFYQTLISILNVHNLNLKSPVTTSKLIPYIAEDKKRRDASIDIATANKVGNGILERFNLNDFIVNLKENPIHE